MREQKNPEKMGQIVRRKKKGRPAKPDPGACRGGEVEPPERDLRRSLRRRNVKYVFDLDDYFDDELFEDTDEDQQRKEKKLKLLLKLQNGKDGGSESASRLGAHSPAVSASASDGDKPSEKRKIDARDDRETGPDEDANDDINDIDNYSGEEHEVRETQMEPKTVHSPPGTPTETLPRPSLPDKKTLELILDKLQKKDIYGVYAEPVDPEELPDYHDVIKHPMDFATVRNKLGHEAYETLEQFESDIFLICANAMQYNAPDTIYHKQARNIQELAEKKIQKIRIRINSEPSEKELKPEQNIIMRSSSILKKQIKRTVNRTVQEPVGSDFSSGATLATGGNMQNVSNTLHFGGSERPGSIDGLVEGNSSLNDTNLDKGEESLLGKGPLSRFGRKLAMHDENRRATYDISLAQPIAGSESIFSTFEGETKQLIPVGLYTDYSYARSLARFAATLGSVAWNVASQGIEKALPQGFKFGRGWVGEYEPLTIPVIILENCDVKEPTFFAKKEHATDQRKVERIFKPSVSPMGNPFSGPFSENKLPLIGLAGDRPTAMSTTNTSGPIKEQQVRRNSSEVKSSFFLSPGTKHIDSATLSYQCQNLQPGHFGEPKKKVLKQVELNSGPLAADSIAQRQISKSSEMEASRSVELASKNMNLLTSGSFKRPTTNGISVGVLPNGKVVNSVDSNIIASSPSNMTKTASYYHHGQGQGISDPVQLMRMLAEKAQDQQKPSNQLPANAPRDSSPARSCSSDSNAAVAAARVWMSVGAGGFRQAGDNTNLHKNQISADSLYNPTHGPQPQASQFRPEFSTPGMHFQPEKNAPLHAFVPQCTQPVRVSGEAQFQNQPMVLPQLVTADLSRFQLQSPWQNLSPQMHAKQKHESLPPDLNIGFQSPGSPGRHSSGVRVDSQQPDLALQL